jgi:hypothetical protein
MVTYLFKINGYELFGHGSHTGKEDRIQPASGISPPLVYNHKIFDVPTGLNILA